MKKFILIFLVAVIFPAGNVFASEGVKIGFVNLQRSLNESESGKRAKSELEAVIKSKQVIIDEKGRAIDKIKSDLEKQSSVMSNDARKSREADLEKMLRDYQRLVNDSQAEIKKKEGDVTAEIINEIKSIVETIGNEENYTLILEDVEGIILFSRKEYDITEKVIKRYNESRVKS